MRLLVIGANEKQKAAKVIAFAEQPHHWYRWSQSKGKATMKTPGDNPRYRVWLPFGFRCVFTNTLDEDKGVLYRDLSVSVHDPYGKMPSPAAFGMIAELFGFTGYDAKAPEAFPQDWILKVDKEEGCIRVCQKKQEVKQ